MAEMGAEPMAEPGAAQDQEQISPEALKKLQAKHRALLLRHSCKNDNGPLKIVERLFIGSVGCALNAAGLKERGVTHCLLVSIGVKQAALETKVPDVTHLVVQIRDAASAAVELLESLPACLDFIDKALATDNGSCLVCSFQGKSRAFAVLCAHLMYKQAKTLGEASSLIVNARSSVAPNAGFGRALLALEQQLRSPVAAEGNSSADTDESQQSINQSVKLAISSLIDCQDSLEFIPLGDGTERLSLSPGLDELPAQVLSASCISLQRELGDPEPEKTPVKEASSFYIGSPGITPQGQAAPSMAKTLGQQSAASADHEAQAMEEELRQLAQAKDQAVAEEDYARAAQIRNRMQKLEQEKKEAAQSRAGAELARLEAAKKSLMMQKAKAVQEEDYELAGQINDQLKALQKRLDELGSAGITPLPTAAHHLANQHAEAEPPQSLAAQQMAPDEDLEKKKLNAERMAKLIKALEQLRNEEKEQPPQAKSLTLAQKCLMYPIVLVLVLVVLMAMNAVLLRGVMYIFKEDGIAGGMGDEN
eukprot:gnl/MRDRNA2_/MRDRNA2_101397_c0_seq1.p1 gnl/MRDRNA2_/MRDRNA2_101397_c0~~gnl/MRDRNA2_/MRDRNA2_101397_c0_seq1.p1  ORF type:complete len:535 (+),score=154.86 gnl/MRDRNA2_/MRDRNA2_101397_c0_seq1:88-1692(+)